MKKELFTLLLLALMGVCLGAQAQTAARAKAVLDKAAAKVSRAGGASASFTISGSKYGKTSGTVAIKGQKFRATTPKAMVWYDGKTQWMYLKSTNEVNVSYPSEAQQLSMNPYKFITMYKKGYKMSLSTKSGSYVVHLTATNSRRSVPEMYVTVGRNYVPQKVSMRQGRSWTVITIRNFRAHNQSDASFRFNSKDFPKAEIIDLR